MAVSMTSEYLWGSVLCLFLGWALAALLPRRRDRVSRIVRVSLLFSVVVVSAGIVFVTAGSSDGGLEALFGYWIVWLLLLALGGAMRFLPVVPQLLMGLLFAALLVALNLSFSQVLRGSPGEGFATAVYLSEDSLELSLLPDPSAGSEKHFLLRADPAGQGAAIELELFHPSDFLFLRPEVFYLLKFPQDDAPDDFPILDDPSRTIFDILEKLSLLERRSHPLIIPKGRLRRNILAFGGEGRPEVLSDF